MRMQRRRARSLLTMFATCPPGVTCPKANLVKTLEHCLETLCMREAVESQSSRLDLLEDLLPFIGPEHSDWLAALCRNYPIYLGAMITPMGEVLGEPLFWFQSEKTRYAVFAGGEVPAHVMDRLDSSDFQILKPGEVLPGL